MGAVAALTRADLKNINREPMLKFLLLYPWLLGLLMRWLAPFVTAGMAETFDLRPYHSLVAGLFGLLITPALAGVVIGFLLLDERDDNTLAALQVTPLTMNRYLAYRIAAPVVVSILSTFIVLPLMNIVQVSYWRLLPMGLIAAMEGPIFALVLASFAANKVQGFAMMKGMGIFFMAPLAAWFTPEPWQWLLGLLPTYWPVKAFWEMLAGRAYWPYLGVGFIVHLLFWGLLLRRFNQVLYR